VLIRGIEHDRNSSKRRPVRIDSWNVIRLDAYSKLRFNKHDESSRKGVLVNFKFENSCNELASDTKMMIRKGTRQLKLATGVK
jgi:hypothetical protein